MLRKLIVFAIAAAAFVVGTSTPAYACCCVPHELCEITGDC